VFKLKNAIKKGDKMPEDKKPATTSNDSNDTLMGVLAYLGILCLIPFLAAKDSKFAQYHAKQGLTLFICEVGVTVLWWVIMFISAFGGLGFLGLLGLLVWLVQIGFFVLSILGIVNVVNKKMVPLPIIGGLNIIK